MLNIGKFCVNYDVKLVLTSYLLTIGKSLYIVRLEKCIQNKIVTKYQVNSKSHIIINTTLPIFGIFHYEIHLT